MRKPPKNKIITFADFEEMYKNAKSQAKIIGKYALYVKISDQNLLADFFDDNINSFSTQSIKNILSISFVKKNKTAFEKYIDKWVELFLSKKPIENQILDFTTDILYEKNSIPAKNKKQFKEYLQTLSAEIMDNKPLGIDNFTELAKYMDENNLEETISFFNSIRHDDSKQSKAAFWIAETLYKNKEYIKTKDFLGYALKAKPANQKFKNLEKLIMNILEPIQETQENAKAVKVETKSEINEPDNFVMDEEQALEIDLEILSKEELMQEYELKEFSNESEEFIRAVANNKISNEGYISFFEENIEKIDFIEILLRSKYRLDDDTRSGMIKSLNRLTSLFMEENNFAKAEEINRIALVEKPNNTDAKRLSIKIKNGPEKEVESSEEITNNEFNNIDINISEYSKLKDELYNKISSRNKKTYLSIVNGFINDGQFKYTHSLDVKNDKEAIEKIKLDISGKLWYLDLEIRDILMNYMFKVEDSIITLAEMHGYVNNDKTYDLYRYLNWRKIGKTINNVIFNVEKLRNDSIGYDDILSIDREQELNNILLNIFRNARNFLVHSKEGIFDYQYSVYDEQSFDFKASKLDASLEELEEISIIEHIAIEEARESHNIFHLILMFILITNNSKIAYSVLSDIDYKLFIFKNSLSIGNSKKFYNAIGLKYNWFKNIVKFIGENE